MTAPLGAVVYLASTLFFWRTPPLPPPPKAAEAPVLRGLPWEFSNPEADQLIAELRDQKKALEARERQMDEWAVRLQAERTELNQATQAVWQLEQDFDKAVVRVNEEETTNLKKLAKVYAGMTPATAATVLGQMDDAVAVKIMLFMKENETAAILETMAKQGAADAKRAAAISEHLRLAITHNGPAK
jgi:flagellar motility protein MotE (MotC chaperone)